MKCIISARRSGRTTKMIEMCAEHPGSVIVAPNQRSAESIFHMALMMGKQIPFPMTFDHFVHKCYMGDQYEKFLFDDLDRSLQLAAGHGRIVAATMESEESIWTREKLMNCSI